MSQAVWPVLWPLLAAAMLLALWRSRAWQRAVSVAASMVHVVLCGFLVAASLEGPVIAHLGGWQGPVGITFVADRMGSSLALVASFVGLCATVYSLSGIDQRRESFGYHALVQTLLAGVCGAFLTGDYFNLYVWFEVMLISSFVLLALGGEKKQMTGALRYVALNLLASMSFLVALGLLYGVVGTLNMADVARRLPDVGEPGVVGSICALLALAFGIKAAAFPVYMWLPASYDAPPSVVSALFAGLLTKVGVYALMRSVPLVFAPAASFLPPLLVWVGLLTMTFGVIGAVAQKSFRQVLSFHIVSQIGYMILALALMTPLGLAAGLFYTLHHILVKTNLFLIAGVARRLCGTEELKEMGGLYLRSPLLAAFFLIPALSLAGIPPLSGFWAKLAVLQASLDAGQIAAAVASLAVGALTLFSMLKLWNSAFWQDPPNPESNPREPDPGLGRLRWRFAPIAALAVSTVAIGFLAGPVYGFCQGAAIEMLDREAYILRVLGAQP